MTKPVILMMGAYPQWDMEALEDKYVVHKYWLADDKNALLASICEDVVAIATKGELGASAALMEQLPNLKIVSCYGVGTDAIDLGFAKAHNIHVRNAPDILTGDVADRGVGLLLAIARQIPQGDQFVREGAWPKGPQGLTTRVFRKKVGIIGMGRIGVGVAKRLAGFDCSIAYFNRSKKDNLSYDYYDSPEELAKSVEFLIITIAGGAGTRYLVNKDVIEALGPKGILVNIARGSTVDEAALIDALQNGKIRGAGLDVFDNEPNIDQRFFTLENVVLQPHHASGTFETRLAMGKLVQDNLAAYFSGQELLTSVV